MYVSSSEPQIGGGVSSERIEVSVPNELGGRLIEYALKQEWPLSRHRQLLDSLSGLVSASFDIPVQLTAEDINDCLPTQVDFKPGLTTPCSESDNIPIFDRALDEESEETAGVVDTAAIREAKQICQDCELRELCLERTIAMFFSEPGVWGGLTGAERSALKRSLITPEQPAVRSLYTEAAAQLTPFMTLLGEQGFNARRVAEKMSVGLNSLWQEFFPFMERPKPTSDFNNRYAEIAGLILDDTVTSERTPLLLDGLGRAIIQTWLGVTQTDCSPQYDRPKLAQTAGISKHSVDTRLRGTEKAIIATVLALADRSFDYKAWYKAHASGCPKSALAFLTRLDVLIPPEMSMEDLKTRAREIIGTDRAGRSSSLLSTIMHEYYALGDGPPEEITALAERYGKTTSKLSVAIYGGFDRLRVRLKRSDK